jgi:pyruvate/2-oxoacid:ferredoxin oxidoreductase alpha subunit
MQFRRGRVCGCKNIFIYPIDTSTVLVYTVIRKSNLEGVIKMTRTEIVKMFKDELQTVKEWNEGDQDNVYYIDYKDGTHVCICMGEQDRDSIKNIKTTNIANIVFEGAYAQEGVC